MYSTAVTAIKTAILFTVCIAVLSIVVHIFDGTAVKQALIVIVC